MFNTNRNKKDNSQITLESENGDVLITVDSAINSPRVLFLKSRIRDYVKILKQEFDRSTLNQDIIIEKLCAVSWRINELGWPYKYKFLKLVSEDQWHLLDYLCCHLSKNADVDLLKLKAVVDECEMVIEILDENINKTLESPGLIEVLGSSFASQHLSIIRENVKHFQSQPFDLTSSIECDALLGLITVVGESAKRLKMIEPSLPELAKKSFEIIAKIRDLLEKKSLQHLFQFPDFLQNIFNSLVSLSHDSDPKCQSILSSEKDFENFKKFLDLLEEESKLTRAEQEDIFSKSLSTVQIEWLSFLHRGQLVDFFYKRFLLDYNAFSKSVTDSQQVARLNLDSSEIDSLIAKMPVEVQECKKPNKGDAPFIKMLRSPKTTVESLYGFLKNNNLDSSWLNCTDKTDEIESLSQFQTNQLSIEKLQKLRRVFSKISFDNSKEGVFLIIKESPWLLDLTDGQQRLIGLLEKKESVDSRETLDNFLMEQNLTGEIINQVLKSSDRVMPYHAKFSYLDSPEKEINRLMMVIHKLVNILFLAKKKSPEKSFQELLSDNVHYKLALQMGIKNFGIFMKDKLNKEIKEKIVKYLKTTSTLELSEKHFWLLERFRNILAHRATTIEVGELAWFALSWATLSYPELRSKKNLLLSLNIPGVETFSNHEILLDESLIIPEAFTIVNLARSHGCKSICVGGYIVGCEFGIQSQLTLMVDLLPGTTIVDRYELQWQLCYLFGWDIKIHTEESFHESMKSFMSREYRNKIITSRLDLMLLFHRGEVKRVMQEMVWYEIFIEDQEKPILRRDFEKKPANFQKVKQISYVPKHDQFASEKKYRSGLLSQEAVRQSIQEKAKNYANSLRGKFQELGADPFGFKDKIMAKMEINRLCDCFYMANFEEIVSFDKEITRHEFRKRMLNSFQLPDKILNSDLSKKIKNYWKDEGDFIHLLSKEENSLLCQFKMFTFYVDEIRNPKIIECLDDSFQASRLVCTDFYERFVDPFEEDMNVHFSESVTCRIVSQGGIYGFFPSQGQSFLTSIQPIQHQYLRINFYTEVLEKLPQKDLSLPILNDDIRNQVSQRLGYIVRKYTPLPEYKKMTTNKIFIIPQSNWRYEGKVQKLGLQSIVFDYPRTKDFDMLLLKIKLHKDSYPYYEQDKELYNEFSECQGYLEELSAYQKKVKKIEAQKERLENIASAADDLNNEVLILSQERCYEFMNQINFLRNTQMVVVQNIFSCAFIRRHSMFGQYGFKEQLVEELCARVYEKTEVGKSKKLFSTFLSDLLIPKKELSGIESVFFNSNSEALLDHESRLVSIQGCYL